MQRFEYINPLQIRKTVCANCETDIETTYREGVGNIWCNPCYTKEFL